MNKDNIKCSTVGDSNRNENCPLVCKAVTDAEQKTTEDSVNVTLSNIWANTGYNIAKECPSTINGVKCIPMKEEDILQKYGSLGQGGFFKSPYNQTCSSRPEIGRESITYFPPNAAGKNQIESDNFFKCAADKGLTNYICEMVNYHAAKSLPSSPPPSPPPSPPLSPPPSPPLSPPPSPPLSPPPSPPKPTPIPSSSGKHIGVWIISSLVVVAVLVMLVLIYRYNYL